MEKQLNIVSVLIYLYLIAAHVCMLWFWYQWSQTHGFFSTLIIGPIISEIKGLLFPFFIQHMEYTYEDVLVQCEIVKDLLKEGKNRRSLDRRNYLIALMYYEFGKTEESIAKTMEMKRETVTSAKFHPYQLLEYNDPAFTNNVKDLMVMFPYVFPNHYSAKSSKKQTVVNVYLEKDIAKKLRSYMAFKDISRIDSAIKDLVIKGLKLWEE